MQSKELCCGCTACMHACPAQCIRMKEDEEGFLYPVLDEARCLHCGKCEAICPVLHARTPAGESKTFVGCCRDDALRMQSASGGIFTPLAQWILQQDGVVFGAAFDENFTVCHGAADDAAGLEKLRGSKYVQSRLGNAYPEVKRYLESGRKVLFTGTACQISGLKAYLQKEYEGLYTMDVLCHGVPSPKIFALYLAHLKAQYGAAPKSLEFRCKARGWKHYCVRFAFANGQVYLASAGQDPYMQLFLRNLDLRPSCHACRFKGLPRASDLTVGDAWGVERYLPQMDDDKGTSVLLAHTPKGEQMLAAIREQLTVTEVRTEVALPQTSDARRAVERHPKRAAFFADAANGKDFSDLLGYLKKSRLQQAVGLCKALAAKLGLYR